MGRVNPGGVNPRGGDRERGEGVARGRKWVVEFSIFQKDFDRNVISKQNSLFCRDIVQFLSKITHF